MSVSLLLNAAMTVDGEGAVNYSHGAGRIPITFLLSEETGGEHVVGNSASPTGTVDGAQPSSVVEAMTLASPGPSFAKHPSPCQSAPPTIHKPQGLQVSPGLILPPPHLPTPGPCWNAPTAVCHSRGASLGEVPPVSRQSSHTEYGSVCWGISDLTGSDSRSSLDAAKSAQETPSPMMPRMTRPNLLPSFELKGMGRREWSLGHSSSTHRFGASGYQSRFSGKLRAPTAHPLPTLDEVDEAMNDSESEKTNENECRPSAGESARSPFLGRKDNHRAPRRRWKEWEDELLIRVVEREGPSRWNEIAKSFPGRNGRQVRLRWMNHLQPSLERAPWRAEEDEKLLAAHASVGNKWALIAAQLGGRTDNAVKNRFKSLQRKNFRELRASRNSLRQSR